ncbi:DUF4291 domain-containing protein [Caldimonas brevitalea]|uniref:DUF4291 domain-containing protein n=1 Tax=Caldimonas brevitalea TaxID=413882 RepID=A0A0G3BNW7_9BURK|nr:DUF4291 domain-containing protein [Caldimonas brevitalea]AKJ31097.1 hypothetical protein AAW51_4406 [Caldimonas brevitalea]
MNDDTVVMFRPTGPEELALVAQSGFKRWPPRLPDQPIFYPVSNEPYAIEIARDWNVPASGQGYVTRFRVRKSFMARYPLQQVGARHHTEWWIPADELEQFNQQIVGSIEVLWRFDTQGAHATGRQLAVAPYLAQQAGWPQEGEQVMAQYDATSVIVYQAYRPSIARYVLDHGEFGGPDFSFSRMSWIKPNFLWMMYRCGWGTQEGQETILALRVRREFFDALLEQAVPSSFDATRYASRQAWSDAVAASEVRLQWDPDHAPSGAKLARRAVQLGLRGSVLARYAKEALVEVVDMTGFVATQRPHAADDSSELLTPVEEVYPAPATTTTEPSR